MLTPSLTSWVASDFVRAGSSWSLRGLISSGRPFTPPAALIFLISICAASSAGASNGAMFFVRSIAAPITIGFPAAAVRATLLIATATSATIAATAIATAASLRCLMPVRLLLLLAVCRLRGAGARPAEPRRDGVGKDLLRLDRLPVREAARVGGDRDLGQALA